MSEKEKYEALVKLIANRCVELHAEAMNAVGDENFNSLFDRYKVLRELISDTHDKHLYAALHEAKRARQEEEMA